MVGTGRAVQALTAMVLGAVAVVGPAAPTIPSRLDFHPVGRAQAQDILIQGSVRIVGVGCRLGMQSGTAVVLQDGRIVTNRHVVDGLRVMNVVPDFGPPLPATGTMGLQSDVALVTTGELDVKGLAVASHDPDPGDPVIVAGYADRYRLDVRPARVVDYVDGESRGEPGPVMRIDREVHPGMSGGPVIDAAGRLAGLVFAVEQASGYGLVIPASRLVETIDEGSFVARTGC